MLVDFIKIVIFSSLKNILWAETIYTTKTIFTRRQEDPLSNGWTWAMDWAVLPTHNYKLLQIILREAHSSSLLVSSWPNITILHEYEYSK